MMRVGLLGGTFDPIHFGHLNLAFELMEKKELDQVWFIPAQVNPFKLSNPPTGMVHRMKMVELAIQGIPQFHLKDLEKNRPSPSYTVDTIRALLKQEPFHEFFLLLGEDAAFQFSTWHLPEEIVRLVPLLVGSRRGGLLLPEASCGINPIIREAIQRGLVETHLMDISATEIRHRLKEGKPCGHLTPSSVLRYIEDNRLYASHL